MITDADGSITIIITSAVWQWLTDCRLEGFINVAEAPAHPNSMDLASKLNIDTITNAMVPKKLGLSNTRECHFDTFPIEVSERYFGEHAQSAKAYRTRDIPDPFFRDIAKFLLEVGCVHLNTYGMPKKKVGVVISTFKGQDVDYGVITGAALQEGLHAFQSGKKLRSLLQQYFTVLFPPKTPLAPTARLPRRRLEELTTSTWEEDKRQSSNSLASTTSSSRTGIDTHHNTGGGGANIEPTVADA